MIIENWNLNKNNYKTKQADSREKCEKYCKDDGSCKSYDWNRKKNKCYLSKKNSSDKNVKMEKSRNTVYGEKCPGKNLFLGLA